MTDFLPVNSLETKLRSILRDRNTPLWNFYTPLAAAQLWVIVRHYPELDGSDQIAPGGKNPDVCIFNWEDESFIGLYTSPGRVEEIFQKWEISRAKWTLISAPGYQVLRWLSAPEYHLVINLGLENCRYPLDPDMVEILLSRPEPTAADRRTEKVTFAVEGNPEQYLDPLKDFLSKQPTVRAAWILSPETSPAPVASGSRAYEIHLVMRDPEDNSLLEKVCTMAKALTPVEMEWQTAVMMADDESFRRLSKKSPPFYRSKDFLR